MPRSDEIVRVVRENPGCTQSFIYRALGISCGASWHKIRALTDKGVLVTARNGKALAYTVAETAGTPPAPTDKAGAPATKAQLPTPNDTFEQALNALVDTVAEQIARRLREAVLSNLRTLADAATPEPAPTAVELHPVKAASPATTVRPPRVLLCGVLPHLFSKLRNEFNGVASLDLVSADESPKRWVAKGRGVDHIVVAVDFVSHKHTEALASANLKYVRSPGGVSTMTDTLLKLVTH